MAEALLDAPPSTLAQPPATVRSAAHGELEKATVEWLHLLGEDGMLLASSAARTYGPNTLALTRQIPLALRPKHADEVAALVRIAAKRRIPLYPVSTGKNWGYGCANPVQDGSVVVDLSRMDRILDFDAELGLVTVEPGVTQGQLAEYLDGKGLPFLVPVTGAGPDASLLGNALERGYGITPSSDHFGAVTALEAVLPNGERYRSALSELGGERVDRAFKWGLGPYLDGLFSQGNLGIVTQATIALAPTPERIEACFFWLRREEDLQEAVLAVRKILRGVGGVMGSVNLMDRRRVLAMVEPYPKDQTPAGGPIPAEVVERLAQRNGIAPWTGLGALYGDPRVVAAARRVMQERLRPLVSRMLFVTPWKARLAKTVLARLPGLRNSRLAHLAGRVDETLRHLAGRPSEIALPLAYWKSGGPPQGRRMDPARDGCGLLWYAPLVPMLPERVRTYVDSVRKTCLGFGLDPLITLTSLSERCFDSTVPILFDRKNPAEVQRAHACHEALLERGQREGFLPYRLGVQSMRKLTSAPLSSVELSAKIKRALDPANIIAPGRYTR